MEQMAWPHKFAAFCQMMCVLDVHITWWTQENVFIHDSNLLGWWMDVNVETFKFECIILIF